MKNLQKYIYWLICTIALLLLVFVGLYATKSPLPLFSLSIHGADRTETISVYEAKNGTCYVFLPSYADLEQVTVVMDSGQKVSLDGIDLSDGMSCENFRLETPYSLVLNDQHTRTLWFYHSANVATIYIDTATGSMEHIHEDKNYEEDASITLYTDNGEINYYSESTTVKGRGNATWDFDKRPYALILSSAADLLDMGAAVNWVLLANALDETNLNNYVAYNLASRAGLPWSPDCRWVDVYLNGEYSGLYLLSEKIEAGETRLNIDSAAGDFLCKFDLKERWSTLRNPFLTNAGRTVEISYPETLEQAEYAGISDHVQQMEQTVLSGTDLNTAPIIDLDSWVRRYLIDEISGNIDSDLASSYFYFSDGVFYAGPVWDYDMTFGNSMRNQEPNAFIAKNVKKSKSYASPYYSVLYENESFYNHMVGVYREAFLPVLRELIDGGIQSLASRISNAAQMNSIRWKSMYDELQSWLPEIARSTDDLIAYLDRRVTFLNRAWIEDVDYCTIQFEVTPGGAYWNISVPKGSPVETSYEDVVSSVWVEASTKEVFDFSQPVMTDLLLTLQQEASDAEEERDTRDYVTYASIAIFFVLFLGLVITDTAHRKKERGFMDEHNRTEIPS